jgi:branched-chain amino acid transport system permease protein
MNTPRKATISSQPSKKTSNWLAELLMDWTKTQFMFSLLILLAAAVLPIFIRSPYYLGIVVLTLIYALVGISWNIVAGIAGQFLIGHIFFFGIGAFTTMSLFNAFNISPWLGIPAGALISIVVGIGITYLASRYGLKLDYFALFTIALVVVVAILFSQIDFLGGTSGLYILFKGDSLREMSFVRKEPYLYIALSLTLGAVVAQYRLFNSRMGRYFIAMREDEDAAAALGVNISYYKMHAVTIAAALAGLGGGFWAVYVTFVDSFGVFNMAFDVELCLVGPIVGGLGSLIGPLLGSIINKPAVELLRGAAGSLHTGLREIFYGGFLILFVLFLPKGITGLLYGPYRKLRIWLQNRYRRGD